jgi:hypothetical protein
MILSFNNTIDKRLNPVSGSYDYYVTLGNIIYNNEIKSLKTIKIPIQEQLIFDRPLESGKYAAVNCYLIMDTGEVYYDKVLVFSKLMRSVSAKAIPNYFPLCQFIVKDTGDNFVIEAVNEYSRMATFSLTTQGATGAQGFTGPQGITGQRGPQGPKGLKGVTGYNGLQGIQGVTGRSVEGSQGLPGATGLILTE